MLIKLMKYEMIRKKNILFVTLAILFLTELVLLFSLYKGEGWIIAFIIISILLFAGLNFFVMYDNIKSLSDDLNQKSGYMLFLTPNHGYNIVGAKMIIGFIEVIIAYVLIVLAIWINYKYANYLYFDEMSPVIRSIINEMKIGLHSIGFNWYHYASVGFSFVMQWFSFITTVYLALILRKTLFSNSRFKGFLSFVMFVVLNVITGVVTQLISTAAMFLGGYGDLITSANGNVPTEEIIPFVNLILSTTTVISLVFIVIFYLASAYLLTEKVDL